MQGPDSDPRGREQFLQLLHRVRTAYAEVLQAHDESCKSGSPLLSPEEVAYLSLRLVQIDGQEVVRPSRATKAAPPGGRHPAPYWDAENNRLWLGNLLLKEFGQSGSFQTLVLDAFQKGGWAVREIEDPLPRLPGELARTAESRLRAAVKNLNRNLPPGTVRFHVDRTGSRVAWEYDGPSRKRNGRTGGKR